jgi:hypothetical protein
MCMGIGMNRGCQWDCINDAMGGHVHKSKRKGPKIRIWIFVSIKKNLSVISPSAFVFVEGDVASYFR